MPLAQIKQIKKTYRKLRGKGKSKRKSGRLANAAATVSSRVRGHRTSRRRA